jgi:hypothetical protein
MAWRLLCVSAFIVPRVPLEICHMSDRGRRMALRLRPRVNPGAHIPLSETRPCRQVADVPASYANGGLAS